VKPPAEESIEAQRILRSYLQLQEQLHATLLAIEQSRVEATLAARTNADLLAARLELIEKALEQQQEQQREAMHNSNKTMLILAGIFVGVGFLTLLFMAMFQLRGMNRLAEIATGLPAARALGAGQLALGPGDPRLLGAGSEPSGGRLQSVIERLEKRINEIGGAAHAPGSSSTAPANGAGRVAGAISPDDFLPGPIAALLGRGESLLKLGQAEAAQACFDEAIAKAPQNAQAQIQKGLALEQLKKPDQAIECYDRAIALDHTMTLAYLRKGSLYNQQERYGEALDCYEQALKAESKS
jgi:tetratricopeptide (TPR) repeat protein